MFMNQRPGIQEAMLGTAATVLYTSPANTNARLSSVTFTNQSAAAVQVSVHLVKAGAALGIPNRVVAPYTLGPNEAWTCPHLNHVMNPGDTLQALSDTASAVSVYGSVIEMSKA